MDIRNYLSLLVFLLCVSVFSQEELAYQTPKKELLKLIDVDLAPTVLSNTKNNVLVLVSRPTFKSAALSQELRLAGLRVDPKNIWKSNMYNKIEIVSLIKERMMPVRASKKPKTYKFHVVSR